MSPWEKLLERQHPGGHFVQVYGADERALARNVARYVSMGLLHGDGVLVIATPEHCQLISREAFDSGAPLSEALSNHQLVFLDAQQTLAEFMIAGHPDWDRFERVLLGAMRQVQPARNGEGLRAYGEMVGVLWKARQFAAAIRLEQLWNKLLERSSFSLYCAYAIDVFGEEFEVSKLDGVLGTHTHLVPAEAHGALEAALNRSMHEILGPQAGALRVLIKNNRRASWAVMPTAESTILWLRKNVPEHAEAIVKRAQRHYRLSLSTSQ
jgi:MEDS: MEthanogen/methylotroph, DcmR Sensory domain